MTRVFSGALRVWGISGTVSALEARAWRIECEGGPVEVHHDPQSGWRVAFTGFEERHAGLPGVLRSLRAELAPHAPAGRLIIAPS